MKSGCKEADVADQIKERSKSLCSLGPVSQFDSCIYIVVVWATLFQMKEMQFAVCIGRLQGGKLRQLLAAGFFNELLRL